MTLVVAHVQVIAQRFFTVQLWGHIQLNECKYKFLKVKIHSCVTSSFLSRVVKRGKKNLEIQPTKLSTSVEYFKPASRVRTASMKDANFSQFFRHYKKPRIKAQLRREASKPGCLSKTQSTYPRTQSSKLTNRA